jgi:adenylyl- and sulfurtransferase ThiI
VAINTGTLSDKPTFIGIKFYNFFIIRSLITFDKDKIFKMSKGFNIQVEGIEKEFPRSHKSAISEKH